MPSTTTTSRTMRELKRGDQIRVQSLSGGVHEVTVICDRDRECLFVRLSTGKLARLSPYRVDWHTLERLGQGDFASAGDEVIVVGTDGVERRGKLLGPIDDRLEMTPPDGHKYSVAVEEIDLRRFRLLFPTTRLRPGDEFVVKSRSKNEYRGLVRDVTDTHIVALLKHDRQEVRLNMSALDMSSVFVLIPVYGASDPPSWVEGA